MSRSASCVGRKKLSTTPNYARTTSSFRWKGRVASSPRRLAAPLTCMALRKSRPSVPQLLASTTRWFSRSWALARAKSTACTTAAPFRKQKNARRSGPRRAQIHQTRTGVDDGRDYDRTLRKRTTRSIESPGKEERDDLEHVRDSRGYLHRRGQGRADACRPL